MDVQEPLIQSPLFSENSTERYKTQKANANPFFIAANEHGVCQEFSAVMEGDRYLQRWLTFAA